MQVKKIKVTDVNGLHLRRAAEIVKFGKRYQSKILLCHNCKFADTCSILEVLGLAAKKGSEIAVIIDGPDERKAAEDISGIFSDGAGI